MPVQKLGLKIDLFFPEGPGYLAMLRHQLRELGMSSQESSASEGPPFDMLGREIRSDAEAKDTREEDEAAELDRMVVNPI